MTLQYGETEGYQPLRELLADNMARYGINAKVENVMITSGSQQALDLIGKLFINAGDRILVEAATYLGALQAFNVYGAEYESVARGQKTASAPTCSWSLCAPAPSSCTCCPTSRTQPEPPCPKCVAMSWCCWRTGLAFRSSRMIPRPVAL